MPSMEINVDITPMVNSEAMVESIRSGLRQAIIEIMGVDKETVNVSHMEIEKVKTLNLPYGNLNRRKLRIRR